MTKSIFRKQLAAAALSGVLVAAPFQAHALISTTDIVNFLEQMVGNLQQMFNWEEEIAALKQQFNLDTALSKLGIENDNNAAANMIIRLNSAAQQINDLELKKELTPAALAADTIAAAAIADKVDCHVADSVQEQVEDYIDKRNNYDKSIEEVAGDRAKQTQTLLNDCKALGGGDLQDSLCLRPGVIGGTGETLSGDTAKASEQALKVLAGASPVRRSASMSKGSRKRQEAQLEEARKDILRGMAISSLNKVAKFYTSPGESNGAQVPSQMDVLRKLDDDRFGSPIWMAEVTATSPQKSKNAMIPEVQRRIAVMGAIDLHLGVMQQDSLKNIEGLLAALVLLESDK